MNSTASRSRRRRLSLLVVAAILCLAAAVAARTLWHRPAIGANVPLEAVARHSIAVTVEATGTVEPIDIVEIKSKASGQIVTMPVEVGSTVERGDLLAQIDKRDVQNQYDQASAALKAAQSHAEITLAQKQRSDALFAQQVITVDEHETATLAADNAQADLVKARTDLDLARQRLEDATLRAPISGTVISQAAFAGQVISSATSSASGGTTLLEMADLSHIRVRALVGETDIGNVRPGQAVTVNVDAFPQQAFAGTIEKIEPQAVVQQSVTMFPVLVSIANEKHQLLPGMNGDISVVVEQQQDAVAIPVDAVRSARELPAMAAALGLDAEAVRVSLQQQAEARGRNRPGRAAAAGAGDPAGGPRGWRAGGRDSLAAFGAHGHHGGGRDSLAVGWLGRHGGKRDSLAAFGAHGHHRGGRDDSSAARGGAGGQDRSGAAAADGATGGRINSRAQAVLVKTAHGFEPRLVRLGLANFDYAEVLDGVKEGEQVALLSLAEVQAARAQDQTRIKQRLGGGVPGAPTGGGGGGRSGGGGR